MYKNRGLKSFQQVILIGQRVGLLHFSDFSPLLSYPGLKSVILENNSFAVGFEKCEKSWGYSHIRGIRNSIIIPLRIPPVLVTFTVADLFGIPPLRQFFTFLPSTPFFLLSPGKKLFLEAFYRRGEMVKN